jgi:hypothetical protein
VGGQPFKYPEDCTLQERHTLYYTIQYWTDYLKYGHHEHPLVFSLQRRQRAAAQAWLKTELAVSEHFDRSRSPELASPQIRVAVEKRLAWLAEF